jgi:hypothetical protein
MHVCSLVYLAMLPHLHSYIELRQSITENYNLWNCEEANGLVSKGTISELSWRD